MGGGGGGRLRRRGEVHNAEGQVHRRMKVHTVMENDSGYSFELGMTRIHSDEGLTLETSVFESFTVANLPYRPRG